MSRYDLAKWIYEQRYLHRTIRVSLAKIIAPGFRKGHTFKTDFFGMEWSGKTNNYLDYQVLLRGAYEKFMLFFMRDMLLATEEKKIVMDIGANIGNHALFISKFASTVHAFEPYEPARASLEEKIQVNNIKNIIIHPLGLSDQKESIPYYPQDTECIGTGSFEKGFCASDEKNAITLEVDRGDDIVAAKNISDVGLIKIDVEGFEIQVLKGLRSTLSNNRPVVIFETLPGTRESTETDLEIMSSLFPEKYSFFVFSRRDKKEGCYSLRRVTSVDSLQSNDIIACPDEQTTSLKHIT